MVTYPPLSLPLCPQVSLSTFAYLFSELVQYCQSRVSNVGELERRLEDVGHGVGLRLLEILAYRERTGRRETRLLDILRFIHTTLWKYLFGRQAKDLEQSNSVRSTAYMGSACSLLHSYIPCSLIISYLQAEDEYMISDFDLFVTKYVSIPKEMGHLNCNAFVAGIVAGILDGAGFPARYVDVSRCFFKCYECLT